MNFVQKEGLTHTKQPSLYLYAKFGTRRKEKWKESGRDLGNMTEGEIYTDGSRLCKSKCMWRKVKQEIEEVRVEKEEVY